jgi:hypothetical protein
MFEGGFLYSKRKPKPVGIVVIPIFPEGSRWRALKVT